jgi:putative transcriptional regulator
MRHVCAALFCLAMAAGLAPAFAESAAPPRAGQFLVASRELPDPNFSETVVLLVESDERSVMGLVVNRRTRIPLSRALRDVPEAAGRDEPVYSGGPVERAGILALVRSPNKLQDARHVFADVYLVSSAATLRKALADKLPSLRVYAGYSGWRASQLRNEMGLGAWHVLPGDAATVFDAEPQSVWTRLIQRTELLIAGYRRFSRASR